MEKDYNTERDDLVIKEYGRNVQKMVAYALSIEDSAKRTRLAYIIVSVMQQINPNPSPNEEYYKKLWNHLNIISNYKFNIEFPYEVLDKESRSHKPEKVPYKDNNIRFRFYGRNMEMALNEIANMEPGPVRDNLLIEAANQLKIMYVTWNKDIINDDLIAAHILKMTNHRLLLPENVELKSANDILKQVKSEQDELDKLIKKKKFTKKPSYSKPRKKPAPRR